MKNCSSEVVYKELFTNQWTSDLSTAQKDTHDPNLPHTTRDYKLQNTYQHTRTTALLA